MNKSFKAAALIALSFAASAPAHAEESLAARAVTTVGTTIAAQGNAALMQIKQEVKDTLREQLKPFLPAAPVSTQPTPAKR